MDKNLLVLSAISGNQESFQRVYEKLKMYAYSMASELFSDSVILEDAINQAMDEVVDKIRNQRGLFENKPWSYVKKSVSNSLIDLARLRDSSRFKQENEGSSQSYEKPLDPKELAWIDEGFARIAKNGDSDSGFRIFNIVDVPQENAPPEKKSKNHPWIDSLEEVLTYQWWWGVEQWEDNKAKINPSNESLAVDDLAFRFKYCSEKMWAKWNLINGLLDNITAQKEKRIMLQYLSGFKQSEIAEKQNVTEPYISKVLSKYRKDWGWNDDDMRQARLMLLSKHLADWYMAPKKYKPPPPDPLHDVNNPKLDELYRKLNKAQADYSDEFSKVNPGWEIRSEYDEEITAEERRGYKIQNDWINKVKEHGYQQALEMFVGQNPVSRYWESVEDKHAKIKSSPEIEAFEAEIDRLQHEIYRVIHPEIEELIDKPDLKSDLIRTISREPNSKRKKYWDSLSQSKSALVVNFTLTKEEESEFAILRKQWENEKEDILKVRDVVIKEAEASQRKENEFYKIVTTSPKMKAYFHDLDLTDTLQLNRLFHIAEAFFRSWYPYVRLNQSSDYDRWADFPVQKDYR